MKKHKIFVYGTLLNRFTRMQICGADSLIGKATLKNFEKNGLNIYEKEGAEVEGAILEVSDAQLAKIDMYEGLGHLYKKIDVETSEGKMKAYQLI